MSPMRALRQIVRPTGRHRAPTVGYGVLDETTLAVLLDSGDAEENGRQHCGSCARSTVHALHADGTATCFDCHTTAAGDQ